MISSSSVLKFSAKFLPLSKSLRVVSGVKAWAVLGQSDLEL
jgi:hypothetical protein